MEPGSVGSRQPGGEGEEPGYTRPTPELLGARMAAVLALLAFAAAVSAGEPASRPTTLAAAFDVRVDPRVELLSVIFRLAGHPEYNKAFVASYAKQVDAHFGEFKDHAVVTLARRLRAARGVSFDAPMSLAVHLSDPPALTPRIPLSPPPAGLDGRWRPDELREFLVEARDFATRSRFAAFMGTHKDLHALAARRLGQTVRRHAHLEWFDNYFGAPPGADFRVVVSILNGPSCYGSRFIDGERSEYYCILGVWMQDADHRPVFPDGVVPTIVHEFCHSYVNPVVDRHAAAFEGPARRMFAQVRGAMRRQAYNNPRTFVYESLVRAAVVRHRRQHEGALAAFAEISAQQARGFLWTRVLCERLTEYERDRKRYPTLDAFAPRLVECFEACAAQIPTTVPASR